MNGTHDFRMPSLGADMDDGVITEWLVAPGDEVRRGQIVVVVETDKSDIEVEVFEHAVVDELLVAEGDRVPVGTPIARLRAVGATPDDVDRVAPMEPAASPPSARPEDGDPRRHEPVPAPVTSPLVRHLCEDLHVDPRSVQGSGPGGRVQRDDVVRAATRRTPRVSPRARHLAVQRGVDPLTLMATDPPGSVVMGDHVLAAAGSGPSAAVVETSPAKQERPGDTVDPMRRAIASLMTRSWAEIPHFHVAARVDVSATLRSLEEHNAGRPPTERVLPAARWLQAVAAAARAMPGVNGWWVDGEFRPAEHVDLGVVVSLRRGGIVAPTIPRAEELSIDRLMAELAGVVSRARAGRLRSSDLAEASLTVTNLGDLGADLVHGVIHPPQVALVGLGAVHDEVVVTSEGALAAHPVLHATLAGDHRALDGLVGATFLAKFREAVRTSPWT